MGGHGCVVWGGGHGCVVGGGAWLCGMGGGMAVWYGGGGMAVWYGGGGHGCVVWGGGMAVWYGGGHGCVVWGGGGHGCVVLGGGGGMAVRPWRIMLEKVADSAFFAPNSAEPYKPYGVQFLEFCSISLSTYQTCIKLPENVLTCNSANFSAGIIRQALMAVWYGGGMAVWYGGGGGAQWRAPSLERGVSRVGKRILETHCIIMYFVHMSIPRTSRRS